MSQSIVVKCCAAALFALAGAGSANAACGGAACVKDFPIRYPNSTQQGSTHEITFNRDGGNSFWITAPAYDDVVNISLAGGQKYYHMDNGSGPHGIMFNAAGELIVSLELGKQVARLNQKTGQIEQRYPVDADPHGLGVGPDGKTLWFTGKTKNTVGRILADGSVANFPLVTPEALPIYIAAGPDGNMWFTELTGNKIGRVSADGTVTEFAIPTPDSRPIAIVRDPSAAAMWFFEEAGNNVGRIDMTGHIVEFPVCKSQANVILAGLAFDSGGNLWVQQYVDQNRPEPAGIDHVIRIGKSILKAAPGDKLDLTSFAVPNRKTVMHRIMQGPDKNMWFTELKSDRVGRVQIEGAAKTK